MYENKIFKRDDCNKVTCRRSPLVLVLAIAVTRMYYKINVKN